MKTNRLHLAAALIVAIPSLTGCGENGITAPVADDSFVTIESNDAPRLGEKLFQDIEAEALASLSLSETILITPFMTGSKTPETASLSEMIEVTPVVMKFQAAFNDAMARLSAGQAVKVTSYMIASGKNVYPYPVLEGDPAVESQPVAQGEVLFEECRDKALATLSLSDAVILTPYLDGSKTLDEATLSEIIEVTPVVVKFQEAFQAELAGLSAGQAVEVTSYMKSTGKTGFPYAELEGVSA